MAQSNVTSQTQNIKDITTISKGLQQCESNVIFQDVSPKTTQEEPAKDPSLPAPVETISLVSPFPDQTPEMILSKEYDIGGFDLDGSFTAEFLNFPRALFEIDAIDRVVSMYRYFKAGVQVDIRLTPSIYHQGVMMVSVCPGLDMQPPLEDSLFRLSAFSPVLLSLSTQQQATVTMNWNSPFPFHDSTWVVGEADQGESQIGSVVLTMVSPYRDTSETGSISVRMFAKFLNPHVAGPLPIDSTFRTMKQRRKKPKHQSSTGVVPSSKPKINVEDLVKTESGTMTSNVSDSLISPILGIAKTGINLLEGIGGLMDKPTSSSSSHLMMHKIARDFTQTSGLDFSQRLSQYPTSRLANNLMFNKQYSSHSSLSAIAQIPMLHHFAAIQKGSMPSTSFILQVHPSEVRSLAYAAGQFDYFSYISRATKFWRGGVRYFFKFVCPSFYKARFRITVTHETAPSLGNKGDSFSRVVEVMGDTDVTFEVPFMLNRYWDYSGAILDAPFILCELIDNIVGGPAGATPIIDVLVFRAAGSNIMFSNLQSATINPPTSLTSTTITTKTAPTTTTQTELIEHQSSLRGEFEKPFESIVCDCTSSYDKNYCTSDQLTTVQEVIKRYGELYNQHTGGGSLNDIWVWPLSKSSAPLPDNLWFDHGTLESTNLPPEILSTPFYYFISLFLYVRGDIRVRLIDKFGTASGLVMASLLDFSGNLTPANSMVVSDLHATPELSFEVPYSSAIPWHPIQGPIPCGLAYSPGFVPHFGVTNGSSTGFTEAYGMYVSASDNFLAGVLMPPPRVWPPSSALKVRKKRLHESTRHKKDS